MIVAVLRVSGTLDIDAFVSQFDLRPDRVWRRGERTRRGEIRDASGFNLMVRESEMSDAFPGELLEYLTSHEHLLAELSRQGASATLDIALMVSGAGSRSVTLQPDALAILATHHVSVQFSGYPVSDDE